MTGGRREMAEMSRRGPRARQNSSAACADSATVQPTAHSISSPILRFFFSFILSTIFPAAITLEHLVEAHHYALLNTTIILSCRSRQEHVSTHATPAWLPSCVSLDLDHMLTAPSEQSFLHIVSLRTATEFIHFTLLINKLTGLYGILAIFTGYHLNPLQLSHYIYSLIVLGLVAWLAPSVRQPSQPLRNVALAWIYVVDSLANSVYTALFGMGWFLLLAQHLDDKTPLGANVEIPGADTINDTAGFTDPELDVTHVNVVAKPAPGFLSGQEAIAYGSQSGSLGAAVFQSGSMASLSTLALLWMVRFYFCIVVMSYARNMLRQYVASSSTASYSQPEEDDLAENPFRVGREEGSGWQGKLGRFMLCFPTKRYWLGRDEAEEAWVKAASMRFDGETGRTSGLRMKVGNEGVGERERRARSGTGPPPPPAKSLS